LRFATQPFTIRRSLFSRCARGRNPRSIIRPTTFGKKERWSCRPALTGSDDKTGGATGLELDADGAIEELDDATWELRWQRLRELGGPPE